jgi:hypothetical protein
MKAPFAEWFLTRQLGYSVLQSGTDRLKIQNHFRSAGIFSASRMLPNRIPSLDACLSSPFIRSSRLSFRLAWQ